MLSKCLAYLLTRNELTDEESAIVTYIFGQDFSQLPDGWHYVVSNDDELTVRLYYHDLEIASETTYEQSHKLRTNYTFKGQSLLFPIHDDGMVRSLLDGFTC